MTLANSPALPNIDMTYTLGEPALSQAYEISQSPDCGYPEVVTLEPSGLPWISVDPATNTISLDALDSGASADIGSYPMKLVKTIPVPDDASGASFTEVKVEVDFHVQIL